MKNTIKRFSFVGGAAVVGVILVLSLIYLGNKSSGPLSDVLNMIGNKVVDIENNILMSKRKPERIKELSWFKDYRENKTLMQHPDTILLGTFDNDYQKSFDPILHMEHLLKLRLPLIQIYIAWGDLPKEEFPMLYAKAIYDLGSTPMITWEPWLNDFNREDDGLPEVTDPNKNGLADIANGEYDFYIKKWALQAKAFGHNILIRYGHEMNDPYRYPWGPQNNKPEEYIAAWRHVVNVFRNLGVNNIIWVWSPQPAYLHYQEYYPGSNYVDWVGVGALNYGTVAPWSKWWSFKEIFGDYYAKLDVFKKPLMITEMGSLDVGGNKTEWFRKAFTELPEKYPDLKALLFFNDNNDNTTLNKSLDWSIVNDTLTCRAIQETIKTKWKKVGGNKTLGE